MPWLYCTITSFYEFLKSKSIKPHLNYTPSKHHPHLSTAGKPSKIVLEYSTKAALIRQASFCRNFNLGFKCRFPTSFTYSKAKNQASVLTFRNSWPKCKTCYLDKGRKETESDTDGIRNSDSKAMRKENAAHSILVHWELQGCCTTNEIFLVCSVSILFCSI